MVVFMLYMKADLENVASISMKKDDDLCISVKNPLSDYEVREKVILNPSVLLEPEENSRSDPCHLSLKWEGNKKPCALTVLTEQEVKTTLKKKSLKKEYQPADYTESGTWQPILCCECRGLEPTTYYPGSEFTIKSTGGTSFTEDIDLSDTDWTEYDADHDVPVALSQIEFKWEAV
jgi:Eukaryotic protein of unknown function (DUF866)